MRIVKGLGLNYKYSSSSKRIYITQPVIPSDSTTQVQTQPSGSVQYTNYNKSLSAYVTAEKNNIQLTVARASVHQLTQAISIHQRIQQIIFSS